MSNVPSVTYRRLPRFRDLLPFFPRLCCATVRGCPASRAGARAGHPVGGRPCSPSPLLFVVSIWCLLQLRCSLPIRHANVRTSDATEEHNLRAWRPRQARLLPDGMRAATVLGFCDRAATSSPGGPGKRDSCPPACRPHPPSAFVAAAWPLRLLPDPVLLGSDRLCPCVGR